MRRGSGIQLVEVTRCVMLAAHERWASRELKVRDWQQRPVHVPRARDCARGRRRGEEGAEQWEGEQSKQWMGKKDTAKTVGKETGNLGQRNGNWALQIALHSEGEKVWGLGLYLSMADRQARNKSRNCHHTTPEHPRSARQKWQSRAEKDDTGREEKEAENHARFRGRNVPFVAFQSRCLKRLSLQISSPGFAAQNREILVGRPRIVSTPFASPHHHNCDEKSF